jgi:hypothetical protein
MRRISPTTFKIARRGTSREINRQIALNLVRTRQPISRAELALIPGAGETEILTVALNEHPRLRGAASLISSPAFAAPIVA